jgi:hypothetical protein
MGVRKKSAKYSGDVTEKSLLSAVGESCSKKEKNRPRGKYRFNHPFQNKVRLPQFFKPGRVGGRIQHRVLNISVPQIILNQSGVRSLIS